MPDTAPRATVRMYRQGLGDFLLVTLPRDGQDPFRMLIDCGVILGTANAGPLMTRLVTELAADVNHKLDVVVMTHHHWDHVSGFAQAKAVFDTIAVGEVWASWIDDPSDAQGRQILGTHAQAETALRATAEHMQGLGMDDTAWQLESLLAFRGPASGTGSEEDGLGAAAKGALSTDQAVKNVLGLSRNPVRYLKPGDAPIQPQGVSARVYPLGPPRDSALLNKMDPSTSHPETYGFAALSGLINDVWPGATGEVDKRPFDANQTIALEADGAFPPLAFADYQDPANAWRRIDQDWLSGASALALSFDQAVNNTSLVLAIELGDTPGQGEVLLFAADAQVGNWLSWQSLVWDLGGGARTTGPDLLGRTVVYKVGHHASHNATLSAQGLELMQRLSVALICIDEVMAHVKRWLGMPFPALLAALDKHTGGRVLRSDKPIPDVATNAVKGGGPTGDDYYEVSI